MINTLFQFPEDRAVGSQINLTQQVSSNVGWRNCQVGDWVVSCCTSKLETDYDALADQTVGVITGVHGAHVLIGTRGCRVKKNRY